MAHRPNTDVYNAELVYSCLSWPTCLLFMRTLFSAVVLCDLVVVNIDITHAQVNTVKVHRKLALRMCIIISGL